MIGHAKLLAALTQVVKRTKADAVSACAHVSRRQVFRFAYEAIHQDLIRERVGITIKVVHHQRVGVASTEAMDAQSLSRCAHAALEIACNSPKVTELPPLPGGHHLHSREDHVAATAGTSPASCVASIRHAFRLCRGAGASLAGSLATGEDEFAVANSSGVSCYAASTVCGAKLVTMFGKLSGYASGVAHDWRRLDLDALLERALRQSLHRAEPIHVPLGSYEVILEPEAVAELVSWLGYTAFGAKDVQERTSCLAGRMGEQLFDRRITIYDDGTALSGLRLPFDFEGTPKRKVVLIDRGKAAGIVYDTTYGARFGHPSTGHAMPPDEVEGPLPLHLHLAAGTDRVEDMIRSCKRGLLIPRFHYVNGLLRPREALMTGLTREGTFLIERGKLSAPVRTLRFTQSLLEAFRRVLGVSRQRRLVADPSQELGCAVVPTLHLPAFRFTGHSES